MAYNGGCMIGIARLDASILGTENFVGGGTLTAQGQTPAALEGNMSPTQWPVTDSAFVPYQRALNPTSGTWSFARALTKNILLGSQVYGFLLNLHAANGYTMPDYTSWSFFTASSSTAPFAVASPSFLVTKKTTNGEDARDGYTCLSWAWPSGDYGCIEATSSGSYYTATGGLFGEFCPVQVYELSNPALISFRRYQTAPSTVEIKTMDGAIRRYVTGSAATNISATWQWSDDGTLAKNINTILRIAVGRALPILVYVPGGIYYTDASIDLVVPSNNPTVTMPAPGVYELQLEGSCQP